MPKIRKGPHTGRPHCLCHTTCETLLYYFIVAQLPLPYPFSSLPSLSHLSHSGFYQWSLCSSRPILSLRSKWRPGKDTLGNIPGAHFRSPSKAILSPTLVNSITHFLLPIPFNNVEELALLPLRAPIPILPTLPALPVLPTLPFLSSLRPSSASPSHNISDASNTTELGAFLPLPLSHNPLTTNSTSRGGPFFKFGKKVTELIPAPSSSRQSAIAHMCASSEETRADKSAVGWGGEDIEEGGTPVWGLG
ncbi:hypothetical protein EV356DRAFT_507752 [Viridothelium virens]|uniref:Uncharacterized protein n=1 Tax=Viridothelium virens TaxID=1048519 RepID=A0A6A6GZF2_VIRVR|nr:hypothetical protein EV356DRAFT_507752 [Viridothelium virens]